MIGNFFIAALASLLGSLQVGTVNLSVAHTSMTQNLRAALLLAIGGCLPEALYCSIAIWGSDYITALPWFQQMLTYVVLFIMVIAGFYMIFKKPNVTYADKKGNYFLKGIVLALLNPFLITFWLSTLIYLQNLHIIKTNTFALQIAFIAGASIGAFALLFILAWVIQKKRSMVPSSILINLNRITGVAFLILASVQGIRLVF